jgi:hypothetical protein
MKRTAVRAYCSPTLVLLALDWADGDRDDFLGLAVERTPGMRPSLNEPQAPKSYCRTASASTDRPRTARPIQKFQWWDATHLAEFMRLYEHYRARATWNRYMRGRVCTYSLSRDARWTGRPTRKARPSGGHAVAVAKG